MDDDNDSGSGVLVTDFSGDNDFDFGDSGGEDAPSLEDMDAGTEPGHTNDLSGQEGAGDDAALAQNGQTQPPASAVPASSTPPPVANPQPSQQPASGSQPAAPQQQQSFEEYVKQNAPAWVEHLASNTYKLTEEEAAVLGDAAPIVPKLLARMHLNQQITMMQALSNALPATVANLVNVAQRGTETEQQFFGQYPELKSMDRNYLAQLGYAIRKSNPQATPEEFQRLLAVTAAAAGNIQLSPVRGKPRPHTPANANNRGTPAPRGQPRTVRRDPIADMNSFLRNGD